MRTTLLAVLSVSPLAAQAEQPRPTHPPQTQARELGTVAWQRDHDQALAAAKRTGKPVFLLFQEIPGCATCTGFGDDVLGHPLLAAAIEACFVPLVIRNNVEGEEGEVRKRYEEPAWNNPVVRFLDGDGKDLLPRKDGVYDAHGTALRMVAALERAVRPVPGCLRVALHESAPKTATATFQMHCFWEGEAVLGAVDGVVRTSSAWRDGAEVVEVTFRPDVLPLSKLTELAQAKSCKPVAGAPTRPATAEDQQHALGGTPYAKLDLTPLQRTKVHAALTLGEDPRQWLTPAQVAKLAPASSAKSPR
jgi:hypothetical protein